MSEHFALLRQDLRREHHYLSPECVIISPKSETNVESSPIEWLTKAVNNYQGKCEQLPRQYAFHASDLTNDRTSHYVLYNTALQPE